MNLLYIAPTPEHKVRQGKLQHKDAAQARGLAEGTVGRQHPEKQTIPEATKHTSLT